MQKRWLLIVVLVVIAVVCIVVFNNEISVIVSVLIVTLSSIVVHIHRVSCTVTQHGVVRIRIKNSAWRSVRVRYDVHLTREADIQINTTGERSQPGPKSIYHNGWVMACPGETVEIILSSSTSVFIDDGCGKGLKIGTDLGIVQVKYKP